jgi:excisionase family DNA binding protein
MSPLSASNEYFRARFETARLDIVRAPTFTERLNDVLAVRERLGISHGTFYAEVRAGRLPVTKIGARSFVSESDLLAYLNASRQYVSSKIGEAA